MVLLLQSNNIVASSALLQSKSAQSVEKVNFYRYCRFQKASQTFIRKRKSHFRWGKQLFQGLKSLVRRTPKFSERFDFVEKMHFGCWQGSSLQCKLSLQKLHFFKKLANENFGIKFNLQKIVDFFARLSTLLTAWVIFNRNRIISKNIQKKLLTK